ncbi:MAG: hypothetical protein J7L92_06540, partial [Dehalococcoidia bacterium]|nr:hypothetical protein [Dehalococcoidia bacterium]
GDVVTIVTPVDIAATTTVTVVFELDADIVNPTVGGKYTLFVNTSRAGDMTPVESAEYTIIPAISTYKFVLDFGVAPSASPWSDGEMSYQNIAEDCIPPLRKGEETAFNCTLKTDVQGAAGYDNVRIKFTLDSAPEDATLVLKLYDDDGTTWFTFTLEEGDSDYWGPPAGFQLTADYDETTSATVKCDKPGDYTVTWAVVDLNNSEAVVPSARTVTTTVYEDFEAYDIVLDEGWNLMSLPLIPLDPAIETVLDGIMDDVISVWHYDNTAGWLTYVPGGPSDLATMEDGKAYWINAAKAAHLWVFGTELAVPPALPAAYDVVVGWNMVGFKSITNTKAETYLDGNEWVRIYTYDGGWAIVQDADMMVPGLGYWVAFTAAGTIYP